MLDDFLVVNRQAIIDRASAFVAGRGSTKLGGPEQAANGVPAFVDQLVAALRRARTTDILDHASIKTSGALHGEDLLGSGVTIAQVVRDYGDVCQTITELVIEQGAPISALEFQTLNLCLDDATAEAVAAYERRNRRAAVNDGTERLGILAHEMRNLLNTATLSLEGIKSGRVPLGGSTGVLLGQSLKGLRDLVDRSLAEVRLDAGVEQQEIIAVSGFLEEVALTTVLQADERDIRFNVSPIDRAVMIQGDRPILAAVIANLLDNAFKFSPRGGRVSLTTQLVGDRVNFDVEDDCGGLPDGDSERLFVAFEQRGDDRTGVGLGLAICRKGARANNGGIRVRDLPGKGCVFTLDVPVHRLA